MLKKSKYVKSMNILSQIKQGQPPKDNDSNLLDMLSERGYLIHRPGLREWGADSFELTIIAEKTLEEYKKLEKIRGGTHP
jgi:hypothetical protein